MNEQNKRLAAGLDEIGKITAKMWDDATRRQIFGRSPLEDMLPKRPPPTWRQRISWRAEVLADRLRRAWLVLVGEEEG